MADDDIAKLKLCVCVCVCTRVSLSCPSSVSTVWESSHTTTWRTNSSGCLTLDTDCSTCSSCITHSAGTHTPAPTRSLVHTHDLLGFLKRTVPSFKTSASSVLQSSQCLILVCLSDPELQPKTVWRAPTSRRSLYVSGCVLDMYQPSSPPCDVLEIINRVSLLLCAACEPELMPTFPHHRNKRAAPPAESHSKRNKVWRKWRGQRDVWLETGPCGSGALWCVHWGRFTLHLWNTDLGPSSKCELVQKGAV